MALQDQDGKAESLQPVLSRRVQLAQAEENEEMTGKDAVQDEEGWSSAASDAALSGSALSDTALHHSSKAPNQKQRLANGEGHRTNVKHQRRRRSLNPGTSGHLASKNPFTPNIPVTSNTTNGTYDRRGPQPRPGGAVTNRNGYAYNPPPWTPPPVLGQQVPVPEPLNPHNPYLPQTYYHHAPNGYNTNHTRDSPQAGPYPEAGLYHGSRPYHQATSPLNGQPYGSREHYWDSYQPQRMPYYPVRTMPELRQRSAKPPSLSLQREVEQLRREVEGFKISQQEAERERKEKERAEEEAAERERKAAEREARRKKELAEKLREADRYVKKTQQRNRDLEAQETRRNPARTRKTWTGYDERDLPSIARQTEVDLPFKRHGKMHSLNEQFLQFLESKRQQQGRWSSGKWQRGDDLDRLAEPNTYGLDVIPRSSYGARNDATFRDAVEEVMVSVGDLLRRLHQDSPLLAEQGEILSELSTGRLSRRPRNYPAEASDLLRELAVSADNQRQEDPLPLRTLGLMQHSQGPESFEKNSKLASNKPWDVDSSQKADQEPTDSGYGSGSARSINRSGDRQHTGPAIMREGQPVPARDIKKPAKGKLHSQRDRDLSGHEALQPHFFTGKSDESDGADKVRERSPALHALRKPEAPDPPLPSDARSGLIGDHSARYR
ncbi:MAG: hypothetical protein M1822_001000 [Bathelium mastoideum]|nr:MAG: hypothetical protein M1822_001000 [Bathelium mastoideum]